MTIIMKQLISEAVLAFNVFSDITEKLPIKLSWQIQDIKEALSPFVDRYRAAIQDLIKEHGKLVDAEKGQYKFENPSEFNAKVAELEAIEIEVEVVPINIEDLEKAGVKLSPEQLKNVKKYIVK